MVIPYNASISLKQDPPRSYQPHGVSRGFGSISRMALAAVSVLISRMALAAVSVLISRMALAAVPTLEAFLTLIMLDAARCDMFQPR